MQFRSSGASEIGLDDTIERRWGPRIRARGIYRDPVRASRGHFVEARGRRWLSFMLLTPLPWLPGIKALPFLTLLAQSPRRAKHQGRRHKPLPERARQVMLMILRWLPNRSVIFVGDSSFGPHELAHAVGPQATLISRLRLDASRFAPPAPRPTGQKGRPRIKGKPLPKLHMHLDDPHAVWTPTTVGNWYGDKKDKALEILSGTALWHRPSTPPKTIRRVLVRDPDVQRDLQAFFNTDPDLEPDTIITLFVRRWQVEVTPGSARPSRRRNPAAMVRPRHRKNRLRPARPRQPRLPVGRQHPRPKLPPLPGRLVPQDPLHLLRRHRRRPHRDLARRHFSTLPARPGAQGNTAARNRQQPRLRPGRRK